MKTIQVVLDIKLLEEYLRRLILVDQEERDWRGYQAQPQRKEEYLPWEETAAWPED